MVGRHATNSAALSNTIQMIAVAVVLLMLFSLSFYKTLSWRALSECQLAAVSQRISTVRNVSSFFPIAMIAKSSGYIFLSKLVRVSLMNLPT